MLRNYTRWRKGDDGELVADILGSNVDLQVANGMVSFNGLRLSPDESRMIGVRLIDAAVLADGDNAIREAR